MTDRLHDDRDDLCVEQVDLTLPQKPKPFVPQEVQRLRDRLDQVQRQLWATQARVLEQGMVRLVGRVSNVQLSDSGKTAMLTMVIPDEGDRYQALRLRANVDDICNLWIGVEVTVIGTWRHGRLTLIEVEDTRLVDEPMPEVPVQDAAAKAGTVPDWFDSQAKNQKRDLLKAADGSSSVSDLKVHIVFCTKRRGKLLTAPMVERLKVLVAEAVQAKGLGRLLAVNGEADHVHVALWLPVNVAPSEAMGHIKSYSSRFLRREFPELKSHDDEALWQRGGFVGSIGNGGDLSAVLNYIANQDTPDE